MEVRIDRTEPDAPGAPEAQAALPCLVGIGSSAGGLEALTQLLPGLPLGLGLRYVVVQHMSPTHRSMMSQLLGRTTRMPVLELSDGCRPLPDTVYVTPPNSNVVLDAGGCLRLLAPPNETVPKPSINLFFGSLAEVAGERAIGVVLSGTGSDGAVGLRAIKAAGGYTFAQDPSGAKYEGMVRAAIEAGGVDRVLAAETMGAELARLLESGQAVLRGAPMAEPPPATLQTLLNNLYAQTRIDFSGYKHATVMRRIERRMAATGCLTLEQYVEHARSHPPELQALAQDMLISVTSFFRDRAAYERLREQLQRLLERKPPGEDLRVWVAGCASGEEAYSVAILLGQLLQQQALPRRVQVFASDIDEVALAQARRGVYPASLLRELDTVLIEAHFERHPDGWEVNKLLRSRVVFARHNLVQDPPFVRMDLVCCRNVLIYLQPPLQDRLLKTFHYALNPAGLLFLGRSESVHGSEAQFEEVDRGAHLYRRLDGVTRIPAPGMGERGAPGQRPRGSVTAGLEDLVTRATVQRFAPASVLVDAAGDVRHLRGDLQGLIALPEGRPVFQLMALLRRELRPELARLIQKLREAPSMREAVLGRWRRNRAFGEHSALRLSVQALSDADQKPLMLVCFERRPLAELPPAGGAEGDESGTSALEEQLAATREHLYTVIEQLETSNEEAQSLNEEIQTANEELQSTNQELEASNEELQASNEELTTLNEELQVKTLETQALNTELEGIYASVDFPLLALDARLLLTRINQAVQQQLGIGPDCIGRHVALLPWPAGMPSLALELEAVQVHGRTHASQLVDVGGRDWVLRIMRRVQGDGARAGVLLQMVDNTELRRSQQVATRSSAQLQQMVERSAQLVCLCDPAGRLQLANPVFERSHQLPPGRSVGQLVQDLLPAPRGAAFRAAQLEAMRRLGPVELEETVSAGGQTLVLLASYFPLLDADGAVSAVCYKALDITRRKQDEAALLAASSAQLAAEGIARTKSVFLANMSHEIRTPMNAVLGLTRMILQGELPERAREQLSKVHEAAQALTRILDDVLDFSKIEAGGMRFEERPFALEAVLSGVRSLFAANAQEKGLALLLDVPLGAPRWLLGDAYRLAQVLNNLVSNALKFTDTGEIRIGVAPVERVAAAPDDTGCELRFSVRDSGIGVSPEARESLFQAFTQGDATITRRFGGTGLGLAICQRLVAMMQGQIGVNSEPGQGSEFWFTARFPLAAEPVPPAPEPLPLAPAEAPAALAAAAELPVLRVLLADDNALNQIVSEAVLQRMGHQVTVVSDGAEALAEVCARPEGHYGVVLMDVHMPGMDGLEATRRIREQPQGHRLPILALTAAVMPEDREACIAAGMDGLINKPLDPRDLVEALRDVGYAGEPGLGAGVPVVEGFDVDRLLARVHHNHRLMWSLLEGFVSQEVLTAAELAELLRAGRIDELRLRTHALLGSAMAVEASQVLQATARLNTALRDGADAGPGLHALSEVLDASIASASAALVRHVGLQG